MYIATYYLLEFPEIKEGLVYTHRTRDRQTAPPRVKEGPCTTVYFMWPVEMRGWCYTLGLLPTDVAND